MVEPPMTTINREPLGIRKVDYQQDRRLFRRAAKAEARHILTGHLLASDEQMVRCVADALMRGWEAGVITGVTATKGRVQESLETGRLVKA
jgi:hypothetical protein